MKKNTTISFLVFIWTVALVPAAYKATMVDGPVGAGLSSLPRGSVAYALEEIEQSLLNGQYNRALMLERALKPKTYGLMLPGESSGAPTPPSAETPAPPPPPLALTPLAPTPTLPPPLEIPTPAATPTLTATPPDPVSSDRAAFESYSKPRFDVLAREIDTTLVAPFGPIADLWRSNPVECVRQYQAQLIKVANWSYQYSRLFAQTEWQSLAKYFFDNVIDSWSGITKPIRIRRIGSGIQGAAYRIAYDDLVARLGLCKTSLGGFKQQEIADVQTKVLAARDKYGV